MLQTPRYEQWMLYGTSNDEFCFGQTSDNAEDTSSDTEARSDNGAKRQRHESPVLRLYESEDRIEEDVECANISNR